MIKLRIKVLPNLSNIRLKGRNVKVLVATEILWGIPMSWLFFYQVIFMRSLGLSEIFIGLIISLPLMFQMFMPMLGWYLADKFGRKGVLMSFESVGWIGAMFLWYLASGPLM